MSFTSDISEQMKIGFPGYFLYCLKRDILFIFYVQEMVTCTLDKGFGNMDLIRLDFLAMEGNRTTQRRSTGGGQDLRR